MKNEEWRMKTLSVINLLLKEKYSRAKSEECEGIENISLFLSANFLLYDQTEIQCFSPFVIFQELDISIWISWLESLNLKPTYHKPVYGNNPDQTRNSWNSETNVILILIWFRYGNFKRKFIGLNITLLFKVVVSLCVQLPK